MVNLDIDVELLAKYAYLLQGQNILGMQSSQSSEKAEQTEGASSSKFYQKPGYSPNDLIKDINLKDPKVKYALIKMMKESDIMKLLPMLDTKSLLAGMKFFTKEKLIILLSYLPEEELAKVMMTMFTPEQMMELMPLNVVRNFLTNDKIDPKNIFKYMQEEMRPEDIQGMYLEATGTDIGTTDKNEMIAKMAMLKPQDFDNALQSMNTKHTKGMAAYVLQEQPKLLKEFSSLQMSMCLDKCAKMEIIQGMKGLETDTLAKVAENLPPQLLEQVVTQIDPKIFADQLLTKYTDILDKLL